MEKSFSMLFLVFVIINSNQVHLSKQEELASNNNTMALAKHRMKRNLIFQPGTRIMFRVNTKDNIIRVNQIFAHGWGFRANIDLTQPDKPSLLPRVRRSVTRREIFDTLEELVNQHGFNGKSCILKMICDAKNNEPKVSDGMFSKILKLIFQTEHFSKDDNFHHSNACIQQHNDCPLNLLQVSPFTDL
ncbi:hypothetical protein PVAND_002548 [Polypedilum vanderplanki]|uniref:Uncharacterized protein n=1 Tax=Polypedilum vanderplanki TaxID=319348 RepID=A0A9J6BRQ2_POLVA|nr:hypothetical protein PVAND_002548 [Polypedilum vanderplanki]